jgi:creatinine amidohydrolase
MTRDSRIVRWQTLTRQEVLDAANQGAVIVQPIGSVEQHGPHLPVDVDSFTAEAVAVRAAQRAPFPVLVTPTVWWGVSEYWMRLGGTLALRPEVLVDLLGDIVESIGRHGFRRVLLLNGHAGNAAAMHTVAIRALRWGMKVVGVSYWLLARDLIREKSRTDLGHIGHAGEVETSLQLALRPESVREHLIPRDDSTKLPRSALPPEWAEIAVMPPHPEAESPIGVYGQPESARAEFGAEVLDTAASRLVDLLQAFREVSTPSPREGRGQG